MPQAPRRHDEAERLAALHALEMLDTPHDPRFERIAKATARALRAPICFVTLVDAERQWMRAAFGLDVVETPRSQSVCTYVVQNDGVVVFEDLAADARTADNFLVSDPTGPRFRFYAGAPIYSPEGWPLGALCVLDYQPRPFTVEECAQLEDMASIATDLIAICSDERHADFERRRFRDAIDQMQEGVALYDEEDRLILVNRAFRRLDPMLSAYALPGRLMREIHADAIDAGAFPGLTDSPEEWLDHRCARREAQPYVAIRELNNGCFARVADSYTWSGARITTTADITERMRRERLLEATLSELNDYKNHLEDLVRQRTEQLEDALLQEKSLSAQQRRFVSIVSHEFRTPLAIIDGAAGALQRRRDRMSPEKIESTLAKVRGAVGRLIKLMESTLMISKLEAGKIELHRTSFDLRGLLEQLVDEHKSIAPHAEFTLDIGGLPAAAMLDERLMYSVFDNLISNAVKYGDDTPRIDIRGWAADGDLFVLVSDNGVGIPQAEIEQIGELFFRASTSGEIQGSGVGMNMVKTVAEMHGGAITIESEVGVGSTFTLRLALGDDRAATAA